MKTTSKGEPPSLALRSFSLSNRRRMLVPDPDMNPATLMGLPAALGSKMGTVGIDYHLRRDKVWKKSRSKTLKPVSLQSSILNLKRVVYQAAKLGSVGKS
jgi:hypothetical protein